MKRIFFPIAVLIIGAWVVSMFQNADRPIVKPDAIPTVTCDVLPANIAEDEIAIGVFEDYYIDMANFKGKIVIVFPDGRKLEICGNDITLSYDQPH